jgi:DNA-binding transcriptional LysR family regulator
MPHLPTAAVLYTRLLGRARLRHLQLLVATCDHGNLKRAADQVGMSQPAATQALAELEQLLDTPLFERHARGMRTTVAGQLLIPVVRQMLLALRASTESLSALQQGVGLLRVGMIPAAASVLARVLVQDFTPRHPGVRLEIREAGGEHLWQALASGGLDLVLSRRPPQLPSSIEFHPLLDDDAVVLAGLGHPLAQQTGLTMQQLSHARWMAAPAGLKVREAFDQFSASADTPPRTHTVSTTSLAFLVEILKDDDTLALVPRSLGHALCAWGLTCALDVTDTIPLEGIGMLASAESMKHPATQSLVEVLRASTGAKGL